MFLFVFPEKKVDRSSDVGISPFLLSRLVSFFLFSPTIFPHSFHHWLIFIFCKQCSNSTCANCRNYCKYIYYYHMKLLSPFRIHLLRGYALTIPSRSDSRTLG